MYCKILFMINDGCSRDIGYWNVNLDEIECLATKEISFSDIDKYTTFLKGHTDIENIPFSSMTKKLTQLFLTIMSRLNVYVRIMFFICEMNNEMIKVNEEKAKFEFIIDEETKCVKWGYKTPFTFSDYTDVKTDLLYTIMYDYCNGKISK